MIYTLLLWAGRLNARHYRPALFSWLCTLLARLVVVLVLIQFAQMWSLLPSFWPHLLMALSAFYTITAMQRIKFLLAKG